MAYLNKKGAAPKKGGQRTTFLSLRDGVLLAPSPCSPLRSILISDSKTSGGYGKH